MPPTRVLFSLLDLHPKFGHKSSRRTSAQLPLLPPLPPLPLLPLPLPQHTRAPTTPPCLPPCAEATWDFDARAGAVISMHHCDDGPH